MARQINHGGHLLKIFGAYIKTDLSALVEINGVASGIIGVIGLAERGPVNEPVTIDSYTQLVETFGDGPLVRHGLAMYVGGASRLICVRTGEPTGAKLTTITLGGETEALDYTWEAVALGSDGNNLSLAVDEGDTTFTIRIKYLDAYGNDSRETFVVPRFIPNPVYVGADGNDAHRYYAGNETDYFVLRDRETGVIREIPRTWDFGNATVDDFLDKVAEMRSSTEDLLGPFPYGDGENPYPLVLIGSIINYGGMGQAPSEFVRLKDIDPGIEDLLAPGFEYDPDEADTLVPHPFVQLAGGTNGDDGTNYYGTIVNDEIDYNMTYELNDSAVMRNWVKSLEVMEDEEVNFIQPAYLFNYKADSDTNEWSKRFGFYKALMPLFLAHVSTMSNIPNRRYRTMVTGLPYYLKGSTANKTAADYLNATQEISGLINTDRVQLWSGGFKSRAFSARLEEYGADMLASFVVGAHASREPSVSLTFSQLSGIFTDGMEFTWNQAQKEELYTRGWGFAMKRRTSAGAVEFVAAHNYTSFTGSPSRGMQLFITRRIVDYVNTFIYKNLEENFIGAKSRGAETAGRMAEFVTALLNRMVREDVIVAFSDVQATARGDDKTVYDISFKMQPVSEVNFVAVTNHIVYNLA